MQSSAVTTGSYQDIYKSQVGTEVGGPGGVGMLDLQWVLMGAIPSNFELSAVNSYRTLDAYPTATTGLGQITITTGANTLGISSFAYPTAGPSRAGGTGNPALSGTIAASAADQALLDLQDELPALLAGSSKTQRQREKVERKMPSFDFGGDQPAARARAGVGRVLRVVARVSFLGCSRQAHLAARTADVLLRPAAIC